MDTLIYAAADCHACARQWAAVLDLSGCWLWYDRRYAPGLQPAYRTSWPGGNLFCPACMSPLSWWPSVYTAGGWLPVGKQNELRAVLN